VMADHVHPTALGQVAIAELALARLERDGMRTAVQPSSLISLQKTRWGRVRGDLTYAYRSAKVSASVAQRLRSLRAGDRRARP